MKLYTNEDLRIKNACYDPARHFEEAKGYTLLDYLNHETCPDKDKIWCVTRFLDNRSNRLFAAWCAKEALKLVKDPDPRSLRAIEVAERFANGEATIGELREAAAAVYAACAPFTLDAYFVAYVSAATGVTIANSTCTAAYTTADTAIDCYSEATKQIEKLKQEIESGNWIEK
jgi:hypothetical protein